MQRTRIISAFPERDVEFRLDLSCGATRKQRTTKTSLPANRQKIPPDSLASRIFVPLPLPNKHENALCFEGATPGTLITSFRKAPTVQRMMKRHLPTRTSSQHQATSSLLRLTEAAFAADTSHASLPLPPPTTGELVATSSPGKQAKGRTKRSVPEWGKRKGWSWRTPKRLGGVHSRRERQQSKGHTRNTPKPENLLGIPRTSTNT